MRELPDSSGKDRIRANLVNYNLLPSDSNESSDLEKAFSKRVYAITGKLLK